MRSSKIYQEILNGNPDYCGEGADWSDKTHFEILKRFSNMCDSVTEFGVYDWNTTWAFIDSNIKKLRSYDGKIDRGKFYRSMGGYNDVVECCKENGIDFEFFVADTRECEIEETDLLFLDTWHTYAQVKSELRLAPQVRKFIVFHDTVLFGEVGSGGEEGIMRAIIEFLDDNKEWMIVEDNKDGNGLMVIERF